MNERIKKVLGGYANLTTNERAEFKKAMIDFDGKGYLEQKGLSETFNKSLGPLDSNPCPCCGRTD